MRVVLQRVKRAEVRVDGRVSGRIGPGLLLLVGFRADDALPHLTWMADRIASLRVFPDEPAVDAASAFSRDVNQTDGGVLIVSQFTLYADTRRGRRPGFSDAAPPGIAEPLYDQFVQLLRERVPGRVATGEFGAMMDVELVNDGPVTLILERGVES
jgi:D-tyrosyl-tRNA(Tyr) deacylase